MNFFHHGSGCISFDQNQWIFHLDLRCLGFSPLHSCYARAAENAALVCRDHQSGPVGETGWKVGETSSQTSQRCATQVLCLIITPLVLLILILIAVFNVSWRTQMYKLWMCRVSDSQDYQVKRNQSSCAHDITKAWLLSWCLSMFVLHVAVGKSKGMLGTFADSAWCSYF